MVSLYLLSVLAFCSCSWERTAALTSLQQEFLDAHNAKRRVVSPSAANMRELKWSDELATVAQNYANKCVYGHNPNKYEEAPSFEKVGENLYYNTAQVPPTRAVTYWDNEKYDYDYDTNTCTDFCSHYTQVAWAETEYVGCAVAYCKPLEGKRPEAYYYVCNYGERGNTNGDRPYLKGSSCSQCPSGYTCNNGLCRS